MQTKFIVRMAGVILLAGGLSACAQTGYYGGTGLSPDTQRAAGGKGLTYQ